jgi:hypothetical protein
MLLRLVTAVVLVGCSNPRDAKRPTGQEPVLVATTSNDAEDLARRWLNAFDTDDVEAWKQLLTDEVKAKYSWKLDRAFAGWKRELPPIAVLRAAAKRYDAPPVEGERTHLVFAGVEAGQGTGDLRIEVRMVNGIVLIDDK